MKLGMKKSIVCVRSLYLNGTMVGAILIYSLFLLGYVPS